MSHGVFNFNFLALLLSEILTGPKLTLGGPTPPGRHLAENFFLHKTSTSQYLIVFIIQHSSSSSFRDYRGLKFMLGGLCPCTAPSGKIFAPEASTLLCLMAFLISTF